MTIPEYLESIGKRYSLGNATEHTFRGDLQTLIESLASDTAATNEPKRIACGAPDYVVTRKNIPIGYIEAKDIGEDLAGVKIKEQRDRYRGALDNLIFTDYLDFHLYRGGELKVTVRIAEVQGGKIVPKPENFDQFTGLIREFASHRGQTIKNSKTLAEMMAEKAKMLAYIIHNALLSDEQSEANSTLNDQMAAFKQVLIHDLDAKAFSDVYAQTIAYGMFAARLHDPSLESFSRREAAELIPKTNPFLRKLFNNIATDIDDRIEWIVDALADVFRAADIAAILNNFGRSTQTHDPIMHFYETFLAAYDPKLRKSRGVFYTPEPVVDFIVRAVDDILKTEFGLPMGLADTTKIKIKQKSTVKDDRFSENRRTEEKEIHRVQILDPATGTGTFLAQVIKQIHKSFAGQQGIWSQYVDEHLIPRLNGFELLMASYAMAHLKLDLLLTELGDDQSSPPYEGGVDAALGGRGGSLSSQQRFRIYLTNALEEYHPETGTLWASWLSSEANEANHIKRDTPVMVVIGNPPYSGESANKGDWIMSLMEDYKKEPGGKEKLKERNPKWINADEVKFLRLGQQLIERNGEGILAFINAHGFLDHPTLRGMRWNLLKTYDKIYVLDLHGNSIKKEVCPDGSPDKNVFDIKQGVSINIFIKDGSREMHDLATVLHFDVYGSRQKKYEFLVESCIDTIPFTQVANRTPMYFFVPKEFDVETEFQSGFSIAECFTTNNVGVVTSRDKIVVDDERDTLHQRMKDLFSIDRHLLQQRYALKTAQLDKLMQIISRAGVFDPEYIEKVTYRPFDEKYLYYENNLIERTRSDVMRHFLKGGNVALLVGRQGQVVGSMQWNLVSITKEISDFNLFYRGGGYAFPLYLYPDDDGQQTLGAKPERMPNLNMEIVGKIAEKIGSRFLSEPGAIATGLSGGKSEDSTTPSADHPADEASAPLLKPGGELNPSTPPNQGGEFMTSFSPIDILDYIYAVLHSPSYREKYKEFLKIDFPRVPYPKDAVTFWRLVKLGGEIRQIHLLESPTVNRFITGYPVGGGNVVEKIEYRTGAASVPLARRDSVSTLTPEEPAPEAAVPALENHPVGEAPPPLLRKEGSLAGRVFINRTQYFEGVPLTAWNFYIGGYQPAQKWLKDRKGRVLNYDDIQHYQKIIVALTETERLMKEIDKIDFID